MNIKTKIKIMNFLGTRGPSITRADLETRSRLVGTILPRLPLPRQPTTTRAHPLHVELVASNTERTRPRFPHIMYNIYRWNCIDW